MEAIKQSQQALFQQHFSHVERTRDSAGNLTLRPIFKGVDRANGHGMSLGKGRSALVLAERLERAMKSGATCPDLTIRTDVNGKTYMSYGVNIMGRWLNADLKRLGF
jgi:hypothetical protein